MQLTSTLTVMPCSNGFVIEQKIEGAAREMVVVEATHDSAGFKAVCDHLKACVDKWQADAEVKLSKSRE